METPKTRILIDPETFLMWLQEEPNVARETLDGGDFNNLVDVIGFLFEDHSKWLFKTIDEMTNKKELGQTADVLQFPYKKSNPFKLVVNNTKDNGEV
ncbi:hypothetical protein [Phosphitispora fastidiosa]|uniref:hypothetical protein n=1 Tax=Phosphitispora fastidiosa TaxID=2837202 RepID=UPI001E327E7B|nr:hypothetical protein [Phosphitispora fastidiosa]MBU7006332.1 hypothetical protein [Phosphitispora fastidiosa]